MRPIRTLARPMVAAPFVITGLETLRDPRPRAEQVAPVVKPIADRMTWLPSKDPEVLVRLQGALSLSAGACLAVGRFQRLATLLLAAQLVPAILTEHRYWAEDDPRYRHNERAHLLKNASLLGALLLVATEPRHRAGAVKQAAREVSQSAKVARARAGRRAERIRRKAAR